MSRNTFPLDSRDSLALRGIAIAAITLHNYFHLLSPVRENEFDFDPRRVFVFLAAVRDPRQIVQSGFSFFGHFGVQVFIFLSAYGLARKYWEHAPGWRLFVWSRIRKIYPLFLAVIVLWAVMLGLPGGATGPLLVLWENAVSLVLTVLGILNLVPGHAFPPVGPWWFVPFIMQLYCLWPLLRRFTMRFGPTGLIALSAASWLLVGAFNPIPLGGGSINLLLSPIGRLPIICLGIAAARYGFFPEGGLAWLAGLVFLLSNFYPPLWPFGSVCALIVAIQAYHHLRPLLGRVELPVRLGACSMALFLVNGFTRDPFVAIASNEKTWMAEILLGVAGLIFAWAFAELLTHRFPRSSVSAHGMHAASAADVRPAAPALAPFAHPLSGKVRYPRSTRRLAGPRVVQKGAADHEIPGRPVAVARSPRVGSAQ